MKKLLTVFVGLVLSTTPLMAQQSDTAALEQKIKDMEERIIALEGQVRQLKSSGAAAPAPAATTMAGTEPQATVPASAGESAPSPTFGGASNAGKALNPDVSVIGDFLGAVGRNNGQGERSLELHESEVGLQAIIDPYARGDFFISFGEEGVNVEEGYITFTALPAGFVAKVGKMRSAFGKVNTMHNHVLPWVDRPLVTNNLVGGEDGLDDAVVSVEHIIPAPKGIFLEATGQLFRGDSGDAQHPSFRASTIRDVSA